MGAAPCHGPLRRLAGRGQAPVRDTQGARPPSVPTSPAHLVLRPESWGVVGNLGAPPGPAAVPPPGPRSCVSPAAAGRPPRPGWRRPLPGPLLPYGGEAVSRAGMSVPGSLGVPGTSRAWCSGVLSRGSVLQPSSPCPSHVPPRSHVLSPWVPGGAVRTSVCARKSSHLLYLQLPRRLCWAPRPPARPARLCRLYLSTSS